jgi:hypothetical protein
MEAYLEEKMGKIFFFFWGGVWRKKGEGWAVGFQAV